MADFELPLDLSSLASTRRLSIASGVCVVLVGLLISISIRQWTSRHFISVATRQTDLELSRLKRQLPDQMALYDAAVRRLRDLILANGVNRISEVSISQAMNLETIDTQFPAANGFGFVRRVPVGSEAAFLDSVRGTTSRPLAIRSLAGDGSSGELDVVVVMEPVGRNLGMRGLDIGSDPLSARAARLAMQSGRVALAAPAAVADSAEELRRMLQLYLPIYQPGMPLRSARERDAAAVGWAYAMVSAERLFERAGVDSVDFALQANDVTDGGPARTFFDARLPEQGELPFSARTQIVPVLDRQWQLSVAPNAQRWREIRWITPDQELVLGVALSLLLGVAAARLPMLRRRRLQQRAFLQQALEASSVGMLLINRHGEMVYANSHVELIFGHSRAELIGQPVHLLVPDLVHAASAWQRNEYGANPGSRALHEGRETRGLRNDGSLVPVEVALNPIQTYDGRFVLGSILDLRERKHNEQVQRQMSALIESATDAILTKDLKGTIQSWNPAASRLLGYEAVEMVGQPITRLLPADRQCEEAMIQDRLREGELVAAFETVRMRKDGTLVDVSLTISPICDASGAVVGASKIMRDITERRRASEQFRLALEAAPTGMILMNDAGVIVLVNEQTERIFGYPREEILGKLIELLIPGRASTLGVEFRGRRRDGSEVPVEMLVNPLKTEAGDLLLSSIVDLSQRREVEKMRSDFVSTVSHELRSPLTSISGSLALIHSGALGTLPVSVESMIQIAHKNSVRLVRIINDILDIGKLDAGQVTLNLALVPLIGLIRQAIEFNAPLAQARGVRCLLDAPAGDDRARTDPDRLMQVLINLLSNATKVSSPDAEVWVRLRASGASLRVEIEDHGPGISEDFRARIFNKFAQADASDSRRHEGSGLGLSISRKLMELMGGSIGFDSVVGRGSTFHIELPRGFLGKSDNYMDGGAGA